MKKLILKSQKNNLPAQRKLAFFYYQKKDYINALYWWNKALLRGDSAEHFNIGVCYYKGWGIKKNLKKAFQHFHKCIKRKKNYTYANALFTLGTMYIYGEATKKNYSKALKLIKESSELNNKVATSFLGVILDPTCDLLPKKLSDAKSSFQFHLKNAKIGLAISQYDVARHYYEGIGIKKNNILASKYFKLAYKNKSRKQHGMTKEQFKDLKIIMKERYSF
jgi:tetratricopeptide (TPR) repeat protein